MRILPLVTEALRAGAIAAACLVVAGCSLTRVEENPGPAVARFFTAPMNAAQEVPPTKSDGFGEAYVTLDPDGTLHWDVAYQGLTGRANAAYFHGPAGRGENGGAVVNIGALGVAARMRGSAHLTEAQIADLIGGLWYADIQTPANPKGEIRGQVVLQP